MSGCCSMITTISISRNSRNIQTTYIQAEMSLWKCMVAKCPVKTCECSTVQMVLNALMHQSIFTWRSVPTSLDVIFVTIGCSGGVAGELSLSLESSNFWILIKTSIVQVVWGVDYCCYWNDISYNWLRLLLLRWCGGWRGRWQRSSSLSWETCQFRQEIKWWEKEKTWS